MSESHHEPEPKNFAPKDPPKLEPPRDDPISPDELAKYDGKIHVFDITCRGNSCAPLLTREPFRHGSRETCLRRYQGYCLRCVRQGRLSPRSRIPWYVNSPLKSPDLDLRVDK